MSDIKATTFGSKISITDYMKYLADTYPRMYREYRSAKRANKALSIAVAILAIVWVLTIGIMYIWYESKIRVFIQEATRKLKECGVSKIDFGVTGGLRRLREKALGKFGLQLKEDAAEQKKQSEKKKKLEELLKKKESTVEKKNENIAAGLAIATAQK